MRRKSPISIAVLAVLFVVASTLVPAPRSAAAAGGTRWGADYFPNVELITQNGQKVRFYDDLLKDKIVAIALIYTHCQDACPLETARMAQVQKMLGDRVGHDIFFYSISIDPERDTPAELKTYAEKFHAGPGWSFLTGKPQDIELISKKLGLYSPDRGRDGHAADLMIGNVAAGQWMRNSATDNPRFLALMIGRFLNSWRDSKTETVKNYAEAPKLSISPGQYLFATHCTACHTIGGGDLVGPDLLGVTEVRERAWLMRLIKTPDRMLAEKDPIATALFAKYQQVRMPNLRLGDGDTAVLIDYLQAQTAAAAHQGGNGGQKTGAIETRMKPEQIVK
jgi:protein SCO1